MKYILLYAVRKLLRSLTWLYFQKYVKDYGDEAAEQVSYPRVARSLLSYALAVTFMEWMKALFLEEAKVGMDYFCSVPSEIGIGARIGVASSNEVNVAARISSVEPNEINIGVAIASVEIEV